MKLSFAPLEPPPWVKAEDWASPNWQFKNALKSESDFKNYFDLSSDEVEGFKGADSLFRIRVTPYYAQLARQSRAIRRTLVPTKQELQLGQQQMPDPLGENKNNPTPRIIHRYPDRVLFLVTDFCSVYCRYCLRKHFTATDQAMVRGEQYEKALLYIRRNRQIREVILSGGDPLTLSDSQLFKVIDDISKVEHVELIRIGSRIPVVNPMRVTDELVSGLKKYHPIYIMTHFNHPKELTGQAAESLTKFVDNGFPVFNQMVLLRGVNNHAAMVQALSRRLLRLRVKPYYMFQADPSEGTDHFRTSVKESREIQKKLWGRLSGLAMPNLSLDIPGGGGKVGIVPNYFTSEAESSYELEGWDGVRGKYVEPVYKSLLPEDLDEFTQEWERVKGSD